MDFGNFFNRAPKQERASLGADAENHESDNIPPRQRVQQWRNWVQQSGIDSYHATELTNVIDKHQALPVATAEEYVYQLTSELAGRIKEWHPEVADALHDVRHEHPQIWEALQKNGGLPFVHAFEQIRDDADAWLDSKREVKQVGGGVEKN